MPNIENSTPQSCTVWESGKIEKLLTLKDVMEIVCLSYSSLDRMMKARTFPQPVNGRGKKLLWTRFSIESWQNRQSEPVSNPMITTPRKQRQEEKNYLERQRAAAEVLDSHRKAK